MIVIWINCDDILYIVVFVGKFRLKILDIDDRFLFIFI